MKQFIFVFILAVCKTSYAQINFDNPPWDINCDTANTQYDINFCVCLQATIADSILNVYYDELIAYADADYQRGLKDLPENATTDEAEYIDQLLKRKEAIARSRADFIVFRTSTCDIFARTNGDGSMAPMICCGYRLGLTVNQLKILAAMKEELYQR